MSRKRDKLEIIYDILTVIKEKGDRLKPTHIIYKSNLSHQMMKEYMEDLISKGLVSERYDKKGKKSFIITDKGFNYLKDYEVVRKFMDSYGLD